MCFDDACECIFRANFRRSSTKEEICAQEYPKSGLRGMMYGEMPGRCRLQTRVSDRCQGPEGVAELAITKNAVVSHIAAYLARPSSTRGDASTSTISRHHHERNKASKVDLKAYIPPDFSKTFFSPYGHPTLEPNWQDRAIGSIRMKSIKCYPIDFDKLVKISDSAFTTVFPFPRPKKNQATM